MAARGGSHRWTNPAGGDNFCRRGWFVVAAELAELALVHQVDQLTHQIDDVIFVTSWLTLLNSVLPRYSYDSVVLLTFCKSDQIAFSLDTFIL